MTASFNRETSRGFAHLEILLVAVAVVIVGAVGYLFYHNIIANKSTDDTVSSTTNKSVAPAPAGTSARIDQITAQDAATEAGVDSNADTQSEQNVTSADSAVSNVGNAYNENDL